MTTAVNKYALLRQALDDVGRGTMTCFGQSMMPIIRSGSVLAFERRAKYEVGDIVFCKVPGGRYVDAHLVTKVGSDGRCMIANNKGYENGWAVAIYGKAVSATFRGETRTL